MSFNDALGWTALNFLTLAALGFYSMQEMACVSFNKIRLQYYVSKGIKRAIWLNYLLQNPSRLFGTTLICVNAAMFIGSECARHSYMALGLSPDLAPLTQVALVVVFAELAPMFAARRYAEHVALLGSPLLYVTAKILTPILWCIHIISGLVDIVHGGGKKKEHAVLNQEELQKILALQDEEMPHESEGEELNDISRNIFSLNGKEAKQIMQPIKSVPILPATSTVAQARILFQQKGVGFIPIFHREVGHIVGIIHPRDLVRVPDTKRVRDYASAPWFITLGTKAMQIVKEFRRSNRSVGIVLNKQGSAVGMITLEDVIEEIFGRTDFETAKGEAVNNKLIMDRTFPGDMKVSEFNSEFGVKLSSNGNLTLAELVQQTLGHHPEVDEAVYIAPFELTVEETSLTEVTKVNISSRMK